ncbi:MAG TPA: hypothetical protein VHV28_07640 [Solirubrobacteraceae bacterium]|jgi:hypothetical protein|nr:hypothetical protein [Solirubrobacteraceae bacterium]
MPESDFEREQEDAAAAEAARIGGNPSSEPLPAGEEQDPAQQPVTEAGGGEAEGFEEAERALIEHASHGDQHAARRVLEDAPDEDADSRAVPGGEPDVEGSPDA